MDIGYSFYAIFALSSKNCAIMEHPHRTFLKRKSSSRFTFINHSTQNNQQLQQKAKQGSDVTVAIEIEVIIKALDRHIETLEAKLSFLIASYNDHEPRINLSDHYKKKIATVKQEIDDAIQRRRRSDRLEQMSVIRYSTFQAPHSLSRKLLAEDESNLSS
jgi:hypothetical protein